MLSQTKPRQEVEPSPSSFSTVSEGQLKFPLIPSSMQALNQGFLSFWFDRLNTHSLYFYTGDGFEPTTEGQVLYNSTVPSLQAMINGVVVNIPGAGGARTATYVVGPSGNSDSDTYNYVTDGTDDNVQIQAAIDDLPVEGGSICLREGTYTLGSASVLVNKSNVMIFGVGAATIITCDDSFDKMFFVTGDNSSQFSNVIFKNIYFDGNAANQSVTTWMIDNDTKTLPITNLLVDECWFINFFTTAVRSSADAINSVVFNSYFEGWTGTDGIYAIELYGEEENKGSVVNCYFVNTSTIAQFVLASDVTGCGFFMDSTYAVDSGEQAILILGTFTNNVVKVTSLNCNGTVISDGIITNNLFEVGNSPDGDFISGSIVNNNLITVGNSAAATFIAVTAAEAIGNTINFGSSANASSVGISQTDPGLVDMVKSNFISGAGIPVTPIPRVTSGFVKLNNNTLSDVTGLAKTVEGKNTYVFEAVLFMTADAVGGSQFAISGTSTTATSIAYEIMLLDNNTNAYTITSKQTALAGSAAQSGTTAGICIIKGLIKVNAGGTLTVQFAQNVANGTSTVSTDSYFIVNQLT